MTSIEDLLSGEKQTTLFGGRGLEKTLNWLNEDFTGYLEITNPEKKGKYFLLIEEKNIILASSKIDSEFVYGKEILKETKKLLKDEETVIEAFSISKENIEKLKNEYNYAKSSKGKIDSFKIKDVHFPEGNFLTRVKDPNELRKILETREITGFGRSTDKNAAIVIKNGEVLGGIYSDKFGTLKRDNSIIDIKQCFPLNIATADLNDLRDVIRSIRFQDPQKFWETGEFPGGKVQKSRQKIGRLELFIKNENGSPIKNSTVDIRKEGKKVSFGQTTKEGRIEKKLHYDDYQIWIKKEGYEPKGLSITIDQDTIRKEIYLEETKTIDLGIQVLSSNDKPIKEALIKVVRGVDDGISGKTNKKGVFRGSIAPGIYSVIIKKSTERFSTRIELPMEAIGEEKNFRIKLPLDLKEIVKKEQETKKEEKEKTFTSFMSKKLKGFKKRIRVTKKDFNIGFDSLIRAIKIENKKILSHLNNKSITPKKPRTQTSGGEA